ncbi:MAG: hypothetical protein AVDCRST_MAG78-58 [uncultured Rubrobacteraceae bacterium]|uniref:Uncharacterized protein n=1 Tax=uncultured Rubrobacteraceae bacterium TaxID=349277 RepID=A0A6J4P522_9ACTN|nr:MAG: hypothetical protein AVDCRST_MAG78-58 [uncultured Rubrobacteraceae bacterium]
MGVHPTSTATPTIPTTRPAIFPFVRASPVHAAATTAANSAVVALSIAAREAVRLISEAAIRENGIAALKAPSARNSFQRDRSFGRRPTTTAKSARAAAARPTRSSMSTKGPRAGTATRIKRNELPQIAPRSNRAPRSRAPIRYSSPLIRFAGVA